MSAESIDLEPLRAAIRQYKMMDIWGDSVQELSQIERQARARSRALEAKDTYVRLMRSSRNTGKHDYREWAVRKALGLRTSKRYTAQATGGKNWQAWGAEKEIED